MKDIIKKILREKLEIPTFRAPKPVNISDEEKQALKNVDYTQLTIDDLGGSGNIAQLKVGFPFRTQAGDAIVVDIQMLQGKVYQPHIHIPEALQGLGLSYKIYQAIIHDFGHLYSGKKRRMNPLIDKVWSRLKADGSIDCHDGQNGSVCMVKNHPERMDLIKFARA